MRSICVHEISKEVKSISIFMILVIFLTYNVVFDYRLQIFEKKYTQYMIKIQIKITYIISKSTSILSKLRMCCFRCLVFEGWLEFDDWIIRFISEFIGVHSRSLHQSIWFVIITLLYTCWLFSWCKIYLSLLANAHRVHGVTSM